jgi:hypothetical protein
MQEAYVFQSGQWYTVTLPACADPSWTFGERQQVAFTMLQEYKKGFTYAEAFLKAEAAIYNSCVPRKEHGCPKNYKKDAGV